MSVVRQLGVVVQDLVGTYFRDVLIRTIKEPTEVERAAKIMMVDYNTQICQVSQPGQSWSAIRHYALSHKSHFCQMC